MALNIAVLPIVIGEFPNPSSAMIEQLQAIVVREESRLVEQLADPPIEEIVSRLVSPKPFLPKNLVEVAYWPEVRTELLAKYAATALDLSRHGKGRPAVRRRGTGP